MRQLSYCITAFSNCQQLFFNLFLLSKFRTLTAFQLGYITMPSTHMSNIYFMLAFTLLKHKKSWPLGQLVHLAMCYLRRSGSNYFRHRNA